MFSKVRKNDNWSNIAFDTMLMSIFTHILWRYELDENHKLDNNIHNVNIYFAYNSDNNIQNVINIKTSRIYKISLQ